MKVGLMTSWNTQCGIAEYSRYLSKALSARSDVELVVLGSRNYDERALSIWQRPNKPPADLEPGPPPVVNCFDVELWNRHGKRGLDVQRILDLGLDVLHVQYECVLYNRARLQELLDAFAGLRVITYHDDCIPPDMPGPWDLEYTHRSGVGSQSAVVIPFGVEDHQPLVRTFGLGRTRSDLIKPICLANGWRFESAATSESAFGGQAWLSQERLHEWLREADAIVLWYDDVPAAGSSQAARTALATRRPVIVNDVTWFADLSTGYKNLYKIGDSVSRLERALQSLLCDPCIEGSSWTRVAELLHSSYDRVCA